MSRVADRGERSSNVIYQLFMGTVGLFFAPLAPLVAVAAAVVFWISSWVYKYQLMFVFVSKTETGGVSSGDAVGLVHGTEILSSMSHSVCGT